VFGYYIIEVIMRKYIFEVEVSEGNDEFWESICGDGVDDVEELLKTSLENNGFSEEYIITFKHLEISGEFRRLTRAEMLGELKEANQQD
jgi:hypothetical protein